MVTAAKPTTGQVIKKLQEAWNKHDAHGIANLYQATASVHHPMYSQPIAGRTAIERDAANWFKAFPDVAFRFPNLMNLKGWCAFAVEMTGTHTGPMTGPSGVIPATNRRVSVRGSIFCHTNGDGLIIEEHRYFAVLGTLRQLGIKPS